MIDTSTTRDTNILPEITESTRTHNYKVGQEYTPFFNSCFIACLQGYRVENLKTPTYIINNTKVEKLNPERLDITGEPDQIIKAKEKIESSTNSRLIRIFLNQI